MLMKTGVLQDTYEACAGGLAQCLFILWLMVMAVVIHKLINKAKNEDDDDNDDDPYCFT